MSHAHEQPSAGGAGPAHRVGYWARYVAFTLVASFLLSEAIARALTETTPAGLLRTRFREVLLLPLRPEEEVVRRALDEFARDRFLETDPELGWDLRRNQDRERDRTNAAGYRAAPGSAYAPLPAEGVVRVMTVGDSFVYCSEVHNHETWQAQLEALRDDLEVPNLGLPGAGTDQALLRWLRDGRPVWSQIVVLGIWPDNLFRNLAVVDYYRTWFNLAFTKPRLVLDGPDRDPDGEGPDREGPGGGRFVNLPILDREELAQTLLRPESSPVLAHDYWYHPRDAAPLWHRRVRSLQLGESVVRRYQRKLEYQRLLTGEIPDALDVTLALVERFAGAVRADGALPVVVAIPDRTRLDLFRGPDASPLLERIREAGIPVIDMNESFGRDVARDGPDAYYVAGIGHHSAWGNELFARYLEEALRPVIERAHALPRPERAPPPALLPPR